MKENKQTLEELIQERKELKARLTKIEKRIMKYKEVFDEIEEKNTDRIIIDQFPRSTKDIFPYAPWDSRVWV